MRLALRLLVAAAVMLAVVPVGAASAQTGTQQNMPEVFADPNGLTNSDFAFWGNHAFMGYYGPDSNPRGGVRIYDIRNPQAPVRLREFECDGLQADPIVWDRNGNGVADLLLLAVDRTMESPECGARRSNTPEGCVPPVPQPQPPVCTPNHGDPDGWEGVRVFTMSDDPANPFTNIRQVEAVYTDCGAHTITAWPDVEGRNPRLLVYVSSYPLRAGPTCGDTEYRNTNNPYDEDPGSPNNPLHGVIQIVDVPLNRPARSQELDIQPRIRYPRDPDGMIEWCEKGLCPAAGFEPGAVACHDIVVHVEHRLAGGACAEQGQVWRINRDGIPNTRNPISVGDDAVSSGRRPGQRGVFPGAVDFFHSVMFDNEAETVNWVDESFGTGCPPRTTYQSRPWNPAGGVHQTGYMFFSDLRANFQSRFHVGDLRPDPRAGEYCSSHMGMAVMGIERDLLVNAWYTGGVDVIDFTNPFNLREIAFNDPVPQGGTWSAYPYTGPTFTDGLGGNPVYASDGVTSNAQGKGFVVYRAMIEVPDEHGRVDHLNPQTMDHEMMDGRPPKDDDDDDDDRGKGRDRDDDDDDDRGKGRDRDDDDDDDDDDD
jgi:hypothetical protein